MGRTGSSHTQTTPSQYNPKRKRRPLHFWQEKAMAPHSSTLVWKNPMDGRAWKTAVHGVAKGRARLSDFTFTFHFDALEKEMATHSSVLAWRIPAWWAAVYGVAQSRTRLKWLSSSSNPGKNQCNAFNSKHFLNVFHHNSVKVPFGNYFYVNWMCFFSAKNDKG